MNYQNDCNAIISNLINLFEDGDHHTFIYKLKKHNLDINSILDPHFKTNLYEKAANLWQCEFLFQNGLKPLDDSGSVLFHCNDVTVDFLLEKGLNPTPAIEKIKTNLKVEKFYKNTWWLKSRLEKLENHVKIMKRILHHSLEYSIHFNVRNEVVKYFLS
jgi:hypothetical protein